jgi:hypothetical protein
MKRFLGLLVLSVARTTHAVTPTGFLGDNFVASGYNSLVGVYIPVICLALIIGMVIALGAGWGRHLGSKVIGGIFAILLLGGGLSWASSISGGTIATSLTVHHARLMSTGDRALWK